MKYFKMGDIIWCTLHNKYAYTDYHVKCEFIQYNYKRIACAYGESDGARVKIIEGYHTGDIWDIDPVYFELVRRRCIKVV